VGTLQLHAAAGHGGHAAHAGGVRSAPRLGVARDLYDRLAGFGIRNLVPPSEDELRRIVDRRLNRSARHLEVDRQSVTAAQHGLAEALRTGAALCATTATSPASLELLTAFSQMEVDEATLRQRVTDLEALLAATRECRS
jgi:hypothetical protein